MSDKRDDMLAFWSERVARFGVDPKSNTGDVWLREVEIASIERVVTICHPRCVLDFGCANGYTTQRLAADHPEIAFTGVDINGDMIKAARDSRPLSNLVFRQADVLRDDVGSNYDLIIVIRAFQNVESPEMQIRVFDKLHELLPSRGWLYFIESYASGYDQINRDRAALELPPLPIHPHLTLLTDAFDRHAAGRMELVERGSPSSSYYLITRLAYSKLAKIKNEPIDYDHPLHRIAAVMPQIGEYGPQKSRLLRKHG